LVGPAREFFISRGLTSLAAREPPPPAADGDHYREMAGRVRELARLTLLIPTLVLLFGVDIKLAGSLSLAVSLPTMLVGFARYSRDRSFVVLAENRRFVLVMAAGSIVGSFVGGRLLGLVPNAVLLPLLAVILVLSAVKVWKHK
jgi:hypothetical protein